QVHVLFFDVSGTWVAQRKPQADELWGAVQEALELDTSSMSSEIRAKASKKSYGKWDKLEADWKTEGDNFTRACITRRGTANWKAVDKHRVELLPQLLADRGLIIRIEDASTLGFKVREGCSGTSRYLNTLALSGIDCPLRLTLALAWTCSISSAIVPFSNS
ncbi:hypothetical protein LSUE1_G001706, partial [Lachnellula suecica]